MNRPEIVSVGIVWDSERPTLEHIMDVFATVGTTLQLGDVFHSVVDNRWAETTNHNLVGVVTYYGKHYSTFFFHTKLRVWIYFDDATVREVGPRWDQVVEKCRKGRYQPLLLLYAVPSGTPVNTENAPKQVTPFYNERTNAKLPPSQSVLRRSVTPSPEKPNVGNTRRAITPNPDGTLAQKPPLPQPYNEYQNLSVIQSNLYGTKQSIDVVDGDKRRTSPEYITRKSIENVMGMQHKMHPQVSIQRTHSSGSSSGVDMSGPEHITGTRRRDSGNWSGDRNSASSSSSTTLENPYLYLVGKVPHGSGSIPGSPTRTKSDSSNGSGVYDAGYDSYSLSSNDSSTMSTLQHLMKMGHLAKIPEDYSNTNASQTSPSCDVLCDEADELLVKSRQLEDEHDLVLALALCNAAATKARAAMNAPYNNPQTLTLARMKHNTCIMRARSLHRRMTQVQNPPENPPEIRHTREGSSGSGRHSRQNSRDKSHHSRQNSKELLVQQSQPVQEKIQPPAKNIEIYATLPKKKDALKNKIGNINIGEDEEYMLYDKPPVREARSIFSRSKNKEANKIREKRSRSEDRNKLSRDFSLAPETITIDKEIQKKDKAKEEKDDKKDKDGKNKKQHKIRRKLLMGGLIKRKNRSMPDLTEGAGNSDKPLEKPTSSVDDSSVGVKGADNNLSSMCGYLSEGHLEFSGSNTNPNLERSRLMRKSFHGSAGKVLTAAKVPPPPPLRTTSQLSTSKLNNSEVCDDSGVRRQYPLPNEANNYYQKQQYSGVTMPSYNSEPVSLPYIALNHHRIQQENPYNRNSENMYQSRNLSPHSHLTTVVTQADVHQEQSPLKPDQYFDSYSQLTQQVDSGVDEVDCMPSHSPPNLDLPPYPSPINSVVHSRQPSEDFPPPPPPLDLSALDEYLEPKPSPPTPPLSSPGSLLMQLQGKKQEIMSQGSEITINSPVPLMKSSGDTWLHELQAKQAALRKKKEIDANMDMGVDEVNTQRYSDTKIASTVRDLASRFENIQIQPLPQAELNNRLPSPAFMQRVQQSLSDCKNEIIPLKQRDDIETVAAEQIAEEMREVEMLNAVVQKTLNNGLHETEEAAKKNKLGKKKSVSFCDQVILVATAEEQEDDSYIPNPILERVLRSAMNKPEIAAIRQEILILREAEKKRLEAEKTVDDEEQGYVSRKTLGQAIEAQTVPAVNQQPIYVRQNSVENLLSRSNISTDQERYIIHQHQQDLMRQQQQHQQQQQQLQQQHYGTSPQMNGHFPQHRQSPYQQVPVPYQQNLTLQNRSHYPLAQQQQQYYEMNGSTPHSSSPRMPQYSQMQQQMRQSPTPSQYNGYQQQYVPQSSYQQQQSQSCHPVYQHPPSPAPSNISYSSSYSHQTHNQNLYHSNGTYAVHNGRPHYPPYQRTPVMPEQQNTQVYQRVPYPEHAQQTQSQYNYDMTVSSSPYQRIPNPDSNCCSESDMQAIEVMPYLPQQPTKYSPYQQVPPPKHMLKKTVSFEVGTKAGVEPPLIKPVVTPIIVNNGASGKLKCNLCRKKSVATLNSYCTDCEFYMSRFKPKS